MQTMTSSKPKMHVNQDDYAIHNPKYHTEGELVVDAIFTCILFLDYDGVLHGFKGAGLFEHVQRLERILRENSHVLVVFSTSWRFNQSMEQMKACFSEDLHDRFVGCTPTVQEKWPPYVTHERYKECMKFLENKKWTKDWVAIDDAKYLFPPDCENLVVTEGNIGMTDADEQKLVALFKRNQ